MSAAVLSGFSPRESVSLIVDGALPEARVKGERKAPGACCDVPHGQAGACCGGPAGHKGHAHDHGHTHSGHAHGPTHSGHAHAHTHSGHTHDHGHTHSGHTHGTGGHRHAVDEYRPAHHGHAHAHEGPQRHPRRLARKERALARTAAGLQAPLRTTYQTFRAAQLGAEAKEGCACCSGGGVPDGPDEVVSALSTGKNAAGTHGHVHSLHCFSMPDTPGEIGLAAGMGIFAGIGFWVGWKNFKQAWDSSRVLGGHKSGKIAVNAAKQVEAQRAVDATMTPLTQLTAKEAGKVARLPQQRLKNLQAHSSNLWGSKSMQRFIQVFSGAVVMGSAALVAGGVFMPLLAAVGTGVQIVYCVAHIARYLGWELKRTRPTAQLKDPVAAGALAKRGLDIFKERQSLRARVFSVTSACFAAYGIGAGLLTANAVWHVGMALLAPGLGLFLAGMVAVLVLNNRHIISTFFNNNEADLEREHQGTKEAQLRRLAHFTDEKGRVDQLVSGLREEQLVASRKAERLQWTQAGTHAARKRALRPGHGNPQRAEAEARRRHAWVGFLADSAAARHGFVREALAATQQERAAYARKFQGERIDELTSAVEDTLAGLDARATAEQRQEAALSQVLLPALQRAAAVDTAPNDADFFALLCAHLGSLDDGQPARVLEEGASDAREHLNRVTVPVATAHYRAKDAWWQAAPGGAVLRTDALRRAVQVGSPRALECARAFCQSAQMYLLYTYPEVLAQQTGSLVDHLAERMKRSQAKAA